MAHKASLKTSVRDDKLVIEISLAYLRAEVAAGNRHAIRINRKNPGEQWPLFQVTNGKAFIQYLLRALLTGRGINGEKLPDLVTFAIEDILDEAAGLKGHSSVTAYIVQTLQENASRTVQESRRTRLEAAEHGQDSRLEQEARGQER